MPLGFETVLVPLATGNLDRVTAPLVLVIGPPDASCKVLALTLFGKRETSCDISPPVLLLAGFILRLCCSIRSLFLLLRLRLRLRLLASSSSGEVSSAGGV